MLLTEDGGALAFAPAPEGNDVPAPAAPPGEDSRAETGG